MLDPDKVDEIKANTVVQREANLSTRMGVLVPLATVDNAEQFVIRVDQVG